MARDGRVGDALAQLREAHFGRVALEDPAKHLDLRRESEVGAALAVRQGATVDGASAHLLDRGRELLCKPRLADAGRTEDGDKMRNGLAGDALPDPAQNLELAGPSDEVARETALACGMQRAQRQPGFDRLGLALGDDRRRLLVFDRLARRGVCLSPDEHAVDRRGRLEARGRVDDVAGDHRLAELRPGAERDQRLAGVDGDPDLHVEPLEGLHVVADRERRPHRALRVVAVGRRSPEDGHDRVADELLDHAAERLELAANEVVVGREERPDVLRVEHFGPGGEADEIDEDDRNEPPLVAARRRRSVERLRARVAETRAVRILLAAAGADEHVLSVGRAIDDGKSGAFGAMTTFHRYSLGRRV
jgi:hypothetical protein